MKFLLPLILLVLLIPLLLQEEYLYPVYAKDLPAGRQDATDTSRFEKRLERKERFENRIEAKKERIASRAAALKEKLSKFRDKRKAAIAERVNENLNKINERRTDAMLKHLDRMSAILGKITGRVNEATAAGKTLTAATQALGQAQVSIETARSAVLTQAEKDYTIEATAEARIRDDARLARNNLHKDLKAVHELMVVARKAVANAISEGVSSLKGVGYGRQ